MLTTLMSLVFSFLVTTSSPTVLASREISLEKRYPNAFVNDVMKKNILLAIDYMGNSFTIEPGQTVSFHDIRLPKYTDATPLLSVHFNGSEGFLSDGWIVGDGVCHLASLIHWVAKDAGLTVEAPTSHDFRTIPQIPKEQGVSIYSNPLQPSRSAPQNLYIHNTRTQPVQFVLGNDGDRLTISVLVVETTGSLH